MILIGILFNIFRAIYLTNLKKRLEHYGCYLTILNIKYFVVQIIDEKLDNSIK